MAAVRRLNAGDEVEDLRNKLNRKAKTSKSKSSEDVHKNDTSRKPLHAEDSNIKTDSVPRTSGHNTSWKSIDNTNVSNETYYDEGDYPTLETSKYTPEPKENRFVESLSTSWADTVEKEEEEQKAVPTNRSKRKLELTSPCGKQPPKRRTRRHNESNNSSNRSKMDHSSSTQMNSSSKDDSLDESQLNKSKKSTYPTEVEGDGSVLTRREKQIELGKGTDGYKRYNTLVPKEKRGKIHPRTPIKHLKWSRRSFDMQVRIWRKQLHVWDPVDGQREANPDSSELEFKDTSENSSIASADIANEEDVMEADNFIRSTPQCSQDDDVAVDLMACALSPLKKSVGKPVRQDSNKDFDLDTQDDDIVL